MFELYLFLSGIFTFSVIGGFWLLFRMYRKEKERRFNAETSLRELDSQKHKQAEERKRIARHYMHKLCIPALTEVIDGIKKLAGEDKLPKSQIKYFAETLRGLAGTDEGTKLIQREMENKYYEKMRAAGIKNPHFESFAREHEFYFTFSWEELDTAYTITVPLAG